MKIDNLLEELAQQGGSDLHLKVGRPPLMRVDGDLKPTEYPPLSEPEIKEMLYEIMPESVKQRYEKELEADVAYHLGDLARFRVNVFQQQGKIGSVMRLVPLKIPSIDQLGLPSILKDIALERQGLILFTGPTGSGKSTSMASMIDHMNHHRWRHIVTIEDPVEFLYTDDECTINQRELGLDTFSFEEALKHVLRQDPDVILMGEMRDPLTMEFALNAAETGHLVFSTLHTNDCKQSLDRILQGYAKGKEQLIRMALAQSLLAIISQRLVPRAGGTGRVAAVEIMINSPLMQELLAEGKVGAIEDAMKSGKKFYGMQTFNQHLAELVKQNAISEQDAMVNSSSPGNLKLLLKGFATGAESVEQVDFKRAQEDRERLRKLEELRKNFSLRQEVVLPEENPAQPKAPSDKKPRSISRDFNL